MRSDKGPVGQTAFIALAVLPSPFPCPTLEAPLQVLRQGVVLGMDVQGQVRGPVTQRNDEVVEAPEAYPIIL